MLLIWSDKLGVEMHLFSRQNVALHSSDCGLMFQTVCYTIQVFHKNIDCIYNRPVVCFLAVAILDFWSQK